MDAGTVSVVIPCHDAADFVGETLECVLGQSHRALDVVVVDDASTDASAEVVAGFGPAVRSVRLPRNGGGSNARNTGAALARGEWLMFLDADDLLSVDAVEGLVEAARSAPGAIARCRWRLLLREEGRWVPRVREVRRRTESTDPLAGWLEGDWCPAGALLWPRAAYDATGGWNVRLRRNEDGDLAMRAFARGVPVVHAARGEAFYRRHGGARWSVSADLSEAALRSMLEVLDGLREILAGEGRAEAYREVLERHYADLARFAFAEGMPEVGRAFLAHGGPAAVRRGWPVAAAGRVAAGVLGLERKERLAAALRRWRGARAGGRTTPGEEDG